MPEKARSDSWPSVNPTHDLAVIQREAQQLRDEVACAHRALDRESVPRNDDHGVPLSLALRIGVMANGS